MRYFPTTYFAMELVLLLPLKLAALGPMLAFALPYTLWNLFEGSLLYSLQGDSSVIRKALWPWTWRGQWRRFWLGREFDTVRRLREHV